MAEYPSVREDGRCTCGNQAGEPHDCDCPTIPPYPGPRVKIAAGVESSVCLNCGGWLEVMPL